MPPGFGVSPVFACRPGSGFPRAFLDSLRDFTAAPHPPAWCMPFVVGVCGTCLALNPPTRSALSQRGPPTGFPPCDSARFGLEPFRPYQDTGRWSGVLRFYGAFPKKPRVIVACGICALSRPRCARKRQKRRGFFWNSGRRRFCRS